MKPHELNLELEEFEAIRKGDQSYLCIPDDLAFAPDALLLLKEWDLRQAKATGREVLVRIHHKTESPQDNNCVLGLRVEPPEAPVVCTKTTGVPCYDKARADEPIFVLRAQDLSSPGVVLEWIKANIETAPPAKLRQAFESALAMSTYGKMRKKAD